MPQPSATTKPRQAASAGPWEPNPHRAVDLAMRLMAIPGKSGEEGQVAEFVVERLRRAGAPAGSICTDAAHRRTPLRGETGNLVFRLPGARRRPRRLMTAHLDTVPLCVGSQPRRKGDLVRSANVRTGLGADNRAGVAVLLGTALEILQRRLPHPPLVFCWFVQEEMGLHGSRCVRKSLLGAPRLAFNWDGGSSAKLTVGATSGRRLLIETEGLASHAGGAPEWGVNAVAIAALAIAELQRRGWHGRIRKGRHEGTSNFGTIHGGQATNVVPDRAVIQAEARSHDPVFRERIVAEIEKAFLQAASAVRNVAGRAGRAKLASRLDYESFRLADDQPCVLAAEAAVRSIGREPVRAVADGGLDANWTTRHGFPTVTIGCGQLNQHTLDEALDLAQYRDACRIALRLATATESQG